MLQHRFAALTTAHVADACIRAETIRDTERRRAERIRTGASLRTCCGTSGSPHSAPKPPSSRMTRNDARDEQLVFIDKSSGIRVAERDGLAARVGRGTAATIARAVIDLHEDGASRPSGS
jgi:hypothetical protein